MIDVKEYLREVERCDALINAKIEERQRLHALTTQITSTIKAVPVFGTGNQDKMGNIIAKIIDVENEIDEAIDDYVDRLREISRALNKLEVADQITVMHKRYFERKKTREIITEMNVSRSTVCSLHREAVQALSKLMNEETEGEE